MQRSSTGRPHRHRAEGRHGHQPVGVLRVLEGEVPKVQQRGEVRLPVGVINLQDDHILTYWQVVRLQESGELIASPVVLCDGVVILAGIRTVQVQVDDGALWKQ